MMTAVSAPPKKQRRASHTLRQPASITAFQTWLTANGAEVLVTTNPYEVVRFRGDAGVSIVYRNDGTRPHKLTGQAADAWAAFCQGRPMRFTQAVQIRAKYEPVVRTLIDRDGDACFYCSALFCEALPPTREHLLSRTHGGPDHIANQALACGPCNRRAGHLSLAEKIRLRDQLRSEVAA